MRFFKQLITGIDNYTVDVARVLWIVGVVAFLCFTGYQVFKSGRFEMSEFAISYSSLLAGGAAGVKIKETTEPQGR